MPGFNGTGPRGTGFMTGGGRGFCAVPYGTNSGFYGRGFGMGRGRGMGFGRGMGSGRGGGRGWRNRYCSTGLPGWAVANGYQMGNAFYPPNAVAYNEIDALREEAGFLKQELEEINKRIESLEKDTPKAE